MDCLLYVCLRDYVMDQFGGKCLSNQSEESEHAFLRIVYFSDAISLQKLRVFYTKCHRRFHKVGSNLSKHVKEV